jgi:cell division protease FtsH
MDEATIPAATPNQEEEPSMNRRQWVTIGLYLVLLILLVGIVANSAFSSTPVSPFESWTTGDLMASAQRGDITQMTFNPLTNTVTGTAKVSAAQSTSSTAASVGATSGIFSVYVSDPENFNAIQKVASTENSAMKWDVGPSTGNPIVSLLMSLLPILITVIVIIWLFKKFTGGSKGGIGGAMSFGKAKVRLSNKDDQKFTFADVAGVDEAVEELEEIKEFLANPAKFKALGAKIPTGVLLVGPPGTGKTLLAKAVAGEAGVPFFTMSGSDFVEMYVGVGSSRVRDLFAQAKAAAPCIVFVDEIDAVGRSRGGGGPGGASNDEREQTLNALLTEMDGFHGRTAVIVMAATNRPDVLDPALLRPGRFDRQILVDRPDFRGREEILKIHSKGKPMAKNVDLSDIARSSAGMSGADLANILNEAALLAARRDGKSIENQDLSEAMERVVAGLKKKHRIMNEKERRIVAYHESGHALVGHLMEEGDPINKVTILPRGRALGYTLSQPEEDTFLESRRELLADLSMLLGGRAAEELTCEDITTGAGNDIERASALATRMVTTFGMSEKLGPRSFKTGEDFLGASNGMSGVSEETANLIDTEVATLLADSYARSKAILEEHRERLDTMAAVLLERETVEGPALDALLEGRWDEFVAQEPTSKKVRQPRKPSVRKSPTKKTTDSIITEDNSIAD